MAYNRDEILKQCLQAIENEGCTTFDEVSLYVKPDLSTLYLWKFNELEAIKNGLTANKIAAKTKLKRQWLKVEAAPVLQLAAFKLMADEDEFNRLTMSKNESKVELPGVALNIVMPDGE